MAMTGFGERRVRSLDLRPEMAAEPQFSGILTQSILVNPTLPSARISEVLETFW